MEADVNEQALDSARDPGAALRPHAYSVSIEDGTLSDALRSRWARLSVAAGADVFQTPDAFDAWHTALSPGSDVRVITVTDDAARLVGVLPGAIRHVRRGPSLGVRYDYDPADGVFLAAPPGLRPFAVRQFTPPLSLPATMLGPVGLVDPSCVESAVRGLATGLQRLRGWDMAVLPLEEETAKLWREACRTVDLTSTLHRIDRQVFRMRALAPRDEVIARQPKKARQNIRRAEAAAQCQGVQVKIVWDRDTIRTVTAQLAVQSWKAAGRRPGQDVVVPYSGRQHAFFEALWSKPMPDVTAALVQDADGPVAIMVASQHQRILTMLLTFWNGRSDKASPGLLAMLALLDWGQRHGLQTVHFNSNNPWLRYFADTREIHQNLLIFAPTMQGRLLSTLSRSARWIRGRGGAAR